MKFCLLHTLVLFYLVLLGINASPPAADYWHSKLPNTSMPRELQKLLQPNMVDKPTIWNLDPTLLKEPGNKKYNNKYGKDFGEISADRRIKYGKPYDRAFMEDGKTIYEDSKHDSDASVSALIDRRERYGKRYSNNFDKDTLPKSTIFFLYNDLHPGKKMKLHLTKSTNSARFLPRQVADSIPFSSNKLPEILKQFSVKPESFKAKVMKQTIQECKSPGIKGEDRFCPTSLESLLDFVVAHTGKKKVEVLYNQIDKPTEMQEYTIMGVKMVGENQVVCHKQHYPYAVYYCHSITGTKVYKAKVVGGNGIQAKAVAVCHSDTQNWNPGHLAFLMLNIKPGEATICHFIRSDTLVWVSK